MYWYSRYEYFINDFFVSKKIKIKAEIVSPGGAYFKIVSELKNGEKQQSIAEQYNVDRSTVVKIKKNSLSVKEEFESGKKIIQSNPKNQFDLKILSKTCSTGSSQWAVVYLG